jgi:hypothetical protein
MTNARKHAKKALVSAPKQVKNARTGVEHIAVYAPALPNGDRFLCVGEEFSCCDKLELLAI